MKGEGVERGGGEWGRSGEKNGGVGMEQVKEGAGLEKESGERREEENQVKNNV